MSFKNCIHTHTHTRNYIIHILYYKIHYFKVYNSVCFQYIETYATVTQFASLDILCESGLLCLVSSSSIMCSRFIHIVSRSSTSFFYCQITCHCVAVSFFAYLLSVDGHLGSHHLLAVTNKSAVNIHAQVCVFTQLLALLSVCLGMELLGHIGTI